MEKHELSINYRGFTIIHRESINGGKELFHIDGDDNYRNDKESLLEMAVFIDNMLKPKFEKINVIMPHWGWGEEEIKINEGIATSITEDGSVWVTYKGYSGLSTRSKMSSDVYCDTPENHIIVNEIFGLIKERKAYKAKIEQEINALKMKLSSPIPTKKKE